MNNSQFYIDLEKLIITYSDKRAHKDKSDRARLLEKSNYLLQDKSRIKSSNKRGGKKYLKECLSF